MKIKSDDFCALKNLTTLNINGYLELESRPNLIRQYRPN